MDDRRCAVVRDGVVLNLVIATPEYAAEMGWIVVDAAADPQPDLGWHWDGERFSPPVAPAEE